MEKSKNIIDNPKIQYESIQFKMDRALLCANSLKRIVLGLQSLNVALP
jgi:hypothetical protein